MAEFGMKIQGVSKGGPSFKEETLSKWVHPFETPCAINDSIIKY